MGDSRRLHSAPVGAAPIASSVGEEPSTADLFALLWEGLADILGTAASAALVARAARGAKSRCPELAELVVVHEGFEYRAKVPARWNERSAGGIEALRDLARDLRALLTELTGSVVVRRLARIPALREHRILLLDQEEDQ